jgi:WD40 repeat protein
MAGARLLHTATLLADGRLLTAGGFNRTTELYDPGTGTWSRTADALDTHRAATATRLPDGRVLLAGLGDSGISSELYEPTSATWARTGDLRTPRLYHTATPLPGGRVLVTGGADRESGGAVLSTAELYDPATGTWTPVAPMAAARRDHTATVMGNGQVLVTGGTNASGLRQRSAEVYDPATGTWSATGAMATPRISHTATLLPNGKVLVSGGYNGAGKGNADRLATAEVYDPASGTWSAAGSMFVSRGVHTATLLPGGTVLIAGGAAEYGVPVSISELYTPEP